MAEDLREIEERKVDALESIARTLRSIKDEIVGLRTAAQQIAKKN